MVAIKDHERNNYFNHWSHNKARWFREDYFLLGRKCINLTGNFQLGQCYSAKEIKQKESWIRAAIRIVSYATVIMPIIGLFYIKADERAFLKYQKTEAFADRCRLWEKMFLGNYVKNGQRPFWRNGLDIKSEEAYKQAHYNSLHVLITALARSDLDPQRMTFKHIAPKALARHALKFFGLEGNYGDILEEQKIEKAQVLAIIFGDPVIPKKNLEHIKVDQGSMKEMTLYSTSERSYNPCYSMPYLSKAFYQFLASFQK